MVIVTDGGDAAKTPAAPCNCSEPDYDCVDHLFQPPCTVHCRPPARRRQKRTNSKHAAHAGSAIIIFEMILAQ